MVYLCNAFSLGMLGDIPAMVHVYEADINQARQLLSRENFISAVGHESTAKILEQILGVPVSFNRANIKLKPGDVAIVFQLPYRGAEGKILSQEELQQLLPQTRLLMVEVVG